MMSSNDTGSDAIAPAVGTHHSCALSTSAGVMCFGSNQYGQLGLTSGNSGNVGGNLNDTMTFVSLAGFSYSLSRITSGAFHTCIWTADQALCWGRNDKGQLGLGHLNNMGDDPGEMNVTQLTVNLGEIRVLSMVAGDSHTCALGHLGGIRCFGAGDQGQLGWALTPTFGGVPAQMPPPPVFSMDSGDMAVAIYALSNSTCAFFATGTATCWGSNAKGELGGLSSQPWALATSQRLNFGQPIYTISTGSAHVCALLASSEIKCFGQNQAATLGYPGSDTIVGDDVGEMPPPAAVIAPVITSVATVVPDMPQGFTEILILGAFFGPNALNAQVSLYSGLESPKSCIVLAASGFGIRCAALSTKLPGASNLTVTIPSPCSAVGCPSVLQAEASFELWRPIILDVQPRGSIAQVQLTIKFYQGNDAVPQIPIDVSFIPEGQVYPCLGCTVSVTPDPLVPPGGPFTLQLTTPAALPAQTRFYISLKYSLSNKLVASPLSSEATFSLCEPGCSLCTGVGLTTDVCQICDFEGAGYYLNLASTECINTGCQPGEQVLTNRTGVWHCGCNHTAGLLLNTTATGCVSGCVAGSYPNVTIPDHQCRLCHSTCQTCVASGSEMCTSCPTGISFTVNTADGQSCVGSCNLCQNGLVRNSTEENSPCVCPPGTFYSATIAQCLPCHGPGQSCVGPCNLCQNGLVRNSTEENSPCVCPPGTFYSATIAQCLPCQGDTYNEINLDPLSTSSYTCQSCPQFTTLPTDTTHRNRSECTCLPTFERNSTAPDRGCVCPPGTYYAPGQRVCQPCPADTFMEIQHLETVCRPCTNVGQLRGTNTSTAVTNPAACVCRLTLEETNGECLCPAGNFFSQALGVCLECPSNSFAETPNLNSSCTPCEVVGRFRVSQREGTQNSTDCVCPAGLEESQSSSGCVCPPGYFYLLQDRKCQICPADTYSETQSIEPECSLCSSVGPHRTTRDVQGRTRRTDCVCAAGFYPSLDGSDCNDCSKISPYATCGGAKPLNDSSIVLFELAGITVKTGYWSSTDGFFLPKQSKKQSQNDIWFVVAKCPYLGACPGGDVPETCNPGYTGPACGLCADSYGRLGQQCAPCPAPGVSVFLVLLIFVFVILGCAFLIRSARGMEDKLQNSEKNHTFGHKIAINHLQIIGFTGNFATQWPEALIRVFAIPASAATVSSASDNIALDCAAHPTLYSRAVLIFVLPLILGTGVALFYLGVAAKRNKWDDVFSNIRQGTLVLLYVAHPGIVQGVLKLMVCFSVGERSYARSDMTIQCSDPSFIALRAFAAVYFVCYGFGTLLLLYHLLHRYPQHFLFLTYGYKPERFYWDLVVTVRQMLFVVVALYASAPLQLFFGAWILLLSWIAQNNVQPYLKKRVSTMDTLSLWVLLVTVTVGNLFYNGVVNPSGADGYTVSVLLVLLNFGTVVVLCGLTFGSSLLGITRNLRSKSIQRENELETL
eukprot:TRINITY_DN8719_c0_g1_i4.p1 TRINITY_DN8719_c0_g1~~TRINITY_DN8719_c0_g1_i4.p1  ORF type:complete len:1459 (-),score=250.74 TRINITY_DN8719_c0_g1_i4:47-4423(-)